MRRLAALTLLLAAGLPAAAAHADWSRPATVTPRGASQRLLALAAVGNRPAVLVAETGGGGRSHRVRLLTSDAKGRYRAARTFPSPYRGWNGSLFAGRDGSLAAAWMQNAGGRRQVVVASGPDLADQQVLTPDAIDVQSLSVAADTRGDTLVTYVTRAGDQLVVAAAYRPAGGSFGAVQILGPITGWPAPRAMVGTDGEAAVAWPDQHALVVADRRAGDAGFGAPDLLPAASSPWLRPAGAIIGRGEMVLSWIELTGPSTSRIEAVSYAGPGAPPTAPSFLSSDARVVDAPSVVSDGGTTGTFIAWHQAPWSQPRGQHDGETAVVSGPPNAWSAPVVTGGPGHDDAMVDMLAPRRARPPMLLVRARPQDPAVALQTATLRPGPRVVGRHTTATGLTLQTPAAMAQGHSRTFLAYSDAGRVRLLSSGS